MKQLTNESSLQSRLRMSNFGHLGRTFQTKNPVWIQKIACRSLVSWLFPTYIANATSENGLCLKYGVHCFVGWGDLGLFTNITAWPFALDSLYITHFLAFCYIHTQFYIQLLYRPHFGTWILPFGLLGTHWAVSEKFLKRRNFCLSMLLFGVVFSTFWGQKNNLKFF